MGADGAAVGVPAIAEGAGDAPDNTPRVGGTAAGEEDVAEGVEDTTAGAAETTGGDSAEGTGAVVAVPALPDRLSGSIGRGPAPPTPAPPAATFP